jgi:hypothetical protein
MPCPLEKYVLTGHGGGKLKSLPLKQRKKE